MPLHLPERLHGCDPSTHTHARALQIILREAFGVPFTLFEVATGRKVPDEEGLLTYSPNLEMDAQTIAATAAAGQARVVPHGSGQFRVTLVVYAGGNPILIAVGIVTALAQQANARAVEQTRLQNWAQALADRLRLGDQLALRAQAEKELRTQMAGAWQVNLTVGECLRRLRLHRDEAKNRQRMLAAALPLLDAEALVWVSGAADTIPVIVGQTPLGPDDCCRLATALAQSTRTPGPEPLLCNSPRETNWGVYFPQVFSLMAFATATRPARAWVIALNKRQGPRTQAGAAAGESSLAPFRHSDAALLSPFVSLLELHARAAGHFQDLKALLVGLARSLTAAIDAKDAYTAGHSERVARIAVAIGRELGLEGDSLSDVYLTGLLHDVGKIGIRDEVLGKPGPLTAEEFEHTQQHVTIGYRILQDLHPIRPLLPGVLHHHERYDGKGYPNGLAGDEVPFLARLLAVADAFDAMNTPRPHRESLSADQVFDTLVRGAGSQWDPHVIAALQRCKHQLLSICQHGLGESLRQAIHTAMRTGDSSDLWEEVFPSPFPGRSS